jgi:hypothetical protein
MAQQQDKRKFNTGQPKKEAKQKKQPITVYETLDDIITLGGKEAVRRICKDAIADALANLEHARLTDPTPDAYKNSKPGL